MFIITFNQFEIGQGVKDSLSVSSSLVVLTFICSLSVPIQEECAVVTSVEVSLGAPECRSGLRHCISVPEVSLQTLVEFQAVSQLAVIGSPIEWCTIGPESYGLGFGQGRLSLYIRMCS